MSARAALEAYMSHESDEDAAEFARRLDAFRAEQLAEGLSDAERTFLTFALGLAADVMASRGDEFTDEDEAALTSLRHMATPAPPVPDNTTGDEQHVFDAVYDALVAFQPGSIPALGFAQIRDDLAQHVTAALLDAGIGGDTIVCDAEGCAIPCTPDCPNTTPKAGA